MKTILISLVMMIAAVSVYGQLRAPAKELKVGDKAPDFALPNPDGKIVTLSEYTARGPVIVLFYRGYW